MLNWLQQVLDTLPGALQHRLVYDPHHLCQYPELSQALASQSQAFHIQTVKSALDLRVQWELSWKCSDNRFLVVANQPIDLLPDIASRVMRIDWSLQQFFPNLHAEVLAGVSANQLERLRSFDREAYHPLGRQATLKLYLEQCFHIDFESLRKPHNWLAAWITLLTHDEPAPTNTMKGLAELASESLDGLLDLLTRDELLKWLQEQWNNPQGIWTAVLTNPDADLQAKLSRLFELGLLSRKVVPQSTKPQVGIQTDPMANLRETVALALDRLQDFPSENATPKDWMDAAMRLAQTKADAYRLQQAESIAQLTDAELLWNHAFQIWLDQQYESLLRLSPNKRPYSVTRILDHIRLKNPEKVALIVVDGMNLWQWAMLSEELTAHQIPFQASATFAWLPSITAWSRQAIFAGKTPDLELNSQHEEKLFHEYWSNAGISFNEINYQHFSFAKAPDWERTPNVIGWVCNDLDELMHGAVMGEEQLHRDTLQWLAKKSLVQVLVELKARGYKIYLTADHGSVGATGDFTANHKSSFGTLSRGQRHLHFSQSHHIDQFLSEHPELGRKGNSVYQKGTKAFAHPGQSLVTHGGSHIFEVIVPFVEM